jgi:precorrin-2/cobalt-factor-2 C20-methyltransferase
MGVFDSGEIKAEIVNQVYPMSRDKDVLSEYWDRAADEVVARLAGGKRGVFITLGDPSLYSTWSYLRPRVESLNIACEIVPGIPSFLMGAARTGRELAIGDDRLAIIPMPENRAELETLMEQFDTLVLMKIGRAMERLREMLIRSGYMDRAWIISRCGLPGEQVMPMDESISDSLGYLSHVIIYKENRSREQGE